MLSDPLADAVRLLRAGRLRAVLGALDTLDPTHAKGQLVRAVALRRLGHHGQARDAASRVLALTQDEELRVEALIYIAAAERAAGRIATARHRLSGAKASAAAADSPFLAGQVYTELARIELRLGRTEEVEGAVQRAELSFRMASAPVPLGYAWLQRARARLDAGRLDEARVTLGAAAAGFRRADDEVGSAWTHLAQASYLLARNSLDAAEASLGEARETFERLDLTLGLARMHDTAGELARARGALEEAADAYRASVALLDDTDDPGVGPRFHLAQVALARGKALEAEAWLEPVLVDAERLRLRRLLGPIHAAMLRVAAPAGDGEQFAHHLREARELLAETGTTTPDAARAAREAGELAARDTEGHGLARAVRAHGLALSCWRRLGDDQQAVADARTLRDLAERGAPIPCGDWDLTEVLGYGAMGEVWRARHHDHHTEAAVKLMLRGEAGNRRLATLIAAEVRAVAALHHPHIVEVLDHGHLSTTAEVLTAGRQRAETPWFAITLARGGTLEAQVGRLPWSECQRILLALLDALAHAHARGAIHLDIKPANVLLDPEEDGHRVLLTDFGLAGALAAFTGSPGLLGTPYTMAPEQFHQDSSAFGPWTDLYALGCLTYHLVQGRPPYPGATVEALREAHLHAPLPELRPAVSVPEGLEAWLHRLLAKSPIDRFSCAADAAFALAGLGEATRQPTDEAPAPSSVSPSLSTLSLTHLGDTTGTRVHMPSGTPVPTSWQLPHGGTVAARSGASLDLFRVRRPPMIGQEVARDAAWKGLLRVTQQGTPGLVALSGPPGSGSSRLLHWLGELAHERGAADVIALTAEADLWPALARSLTGLSGEAPPQQTQAMLQQRYPLLADDAVREVAAAACRVPGPPKPRATALARLLAHRAGARPQLLLLDGPWLARHDGLMLVDAILAGDGGVLVAAEAGPGAVVPDHSQAAQVALTATSDDDMTTILGDLLPLQPHLVRTLVRRAAGNPQLAIELLTDLADRQMLLWRRGRYELREGVVLEMPQGTREVWERRLERGLIGVAGAERPAVVAGALLGGSIPFSDWETACAALGAQRPYDTLQRLERAWLVERGPEGWRFLHPMLEDVAQRLAERDGGLEGACLAVAEVLTHRHPSHSPGRVGLLLARGGAYEASLDPLAEGLDAAFVQGDLDLAHQLVDRRADALQHLGVAASDPRWVHDALGRGRIALREGDAGATLREARRALALASDDAGQAAAHLLLARAHHLGNDLDEAQIAYGRALSAAGDARHVVGLALLGLAQLLDVGGDLEGAEVHLDMAEEKLTDHPTTLAEISLLRGHIALVRGDLELAEVSLRDAVAKGRALGLRRVELVGHRLHGDLRRWRGDLDDARRRYLIARDLVGAHEPHLAGPIEAQLALVALARGDADDAAHHLDRAVRSGKRPPPVAALCQLALQAQAPDASFEAALHQARAQLQVTSPHPDLAAALEAAAVRAAQPSRERLLWAMAADHWRELSRPRHAKRAERALAALARPPESQEET